VYGFDPALSGWRPLVVGVLDEFSDDWSEESGEAVATIGHVSGSVSDQQVCFGEIASLESESIPL
jgi:hypothetical protein